MAYNGLTNLGSAYLAKCMANKMGVTFTKIKVGNGSIPREKTGQTTTDLYGFKKEVEILAKEQVDTALKLTLLLNNLDVVAGFYVKEMGIYIQDNGEEKLYWYINKDNPSYLPDKNTPSNHRYNLYLEVTPVETTVVNFTGQDLLADKKYVDDSIKNLSNKIDTKFKNSVPVPPGGILFMWNSTNPAELYPGTTWYLIPDNKFIKTGATPSQYAGSNSISISKANLPTDKLQVESFSLTRGTMDITGFVGALDDGTVANGAFYENGTLNPTACYGYDNRESIFFQASRSWTGSTSSASPYTAQMGNGTPLTINPEHIIVKAWERLT